MTESAPSDARLRGMVEELDAKGQGLSDWEVGFIANMIDFERYEFSPRQGEIIVKMHEEKMPK